LLDHRHLVLGGPQVLDGVRPPGPPPFGERGDAGRIARLPEPRERAPDPEIRGQERVGVAQCPHRHVGDGPRADSTERHEPPSGLFPVGARVQNDLAARERASQAAQRVAPGLRHGESY
jgi:hypothetical protein